MKTNSFSADEKKLKIAAQTLAERILIRPEWGKIIFLRGEMGAGKTTFLRAFAEFLKIETQSPSFQICRETKFRRKIVDKIDENWTFAHFDFWRISQNDPEILELFCEKIADEKTIVAVETDGRFQISDFRRQISDFKFIEVSLEIVDEKTRRISFDFQNLEIPDEKEISKIFDEFATPAHVRAHCFGVRKVADFLAAKISKNGFPLDLKLISAAAVLHDFVRIVNFENLDFEKFDEKITPQKVKIWENLRAKFPPNFHHAEVGAAILRERNFNSTADVVAAHRSRRALEDFPMTLEKKIVHFADKKVLHDKVVNLQTRLADGKVRHRHHSDETREKLREKTQKLAAELFQKAGGISEMEFDAEVSNGVKS